MARKRRAGKARLQTLTLQQEFELFLGVTGRSISFDGIEEAREAWERHGDRIMEEWMANRYQPGRRPWAWWVWTQGYESPPRDQAAELRRLELLEPWETRRLAQYERLTTGGTFNADTAE